MTLLRPESTRAVVGVTSNRLLVDAVHRDWLRRKYLQALHRQAGVACVILPTVDAEDAREEGVPAIMGAQSSSEAQELIDQVVKAGAAVLDYYASLSPDVARSILSEEQACRIRDRTLNAGNECNALAEPTIYALEKSRENAGKILERMRQSNAPPDQLIRAASGVAKHYLACTEWWEKKALRSERMQSVCAATASLPSATAERRQAEQATLRLHTGWALNTRCVHLQSQVLLARVMSASIAI